MYMSNTCTLIYNWIKLSFIIKLQVVWPYILKVVGWLTLQPIHVSHQYSFKNSDKSAINVLEVVSKCVLLANWSMYRFSYDFLDMDCQISHNYWNKKFIHVYKCRVMRSFYCIESYCCWVWQHQRINEWMWVILTFIIIGIF